MLKYTNTQKTAASFNGAYFTLSAPEDFESIGDGPTRRAVIDWLAAGNTPEPADPAPPAPVPQSVTMRQARLALLGAGKLAAVESAIDALPEPQKTAARIEWEYSNELHRNRELVQALAPALGLTSEQLDTLFITASAL